MNHNVTLFVANGRNAQGIVRDTVRWTRAEGMRVCKIVLVCLPEEGPLVDAQALVDEFRVVLVVRKLADDRIPFHEAGGEDEIIPADDEGGSGIVIVVNGGTTRLGWGLSTLYHCLGDSRRAGRREGDDARMLMAVDCQRDGCHVLASTWF